MYIFRTKIAKKKFSRRRTGLIHCHRANRDYIEVQRKKSSTLVGSNHSPPAPFKPRTCSDREGQCNDMGLNDYYRILEIEPDASMRQIKKAYRKQALKYHPDRNNEDRGAAEKMKSVNEAYAVLSSPAKRRDYDLMNDGYGSSDYDQFGQYDNVEDILWIITKYSK